jgi:hypothetical protein
MIRVLLDTDHVSTNHVAKYLYGHPSAPVREWSVGALILSTPGGLLMFPCARTAPRRLWLAFAFLCCLAMPGLAGEPKEGIVTSRPFLSPPPRSHTSSHRDDSIARAAAVNPHACHSPLGVPDQAQ